MKLCQNNKKFKNLKNILDYIDNNFKFVSKMFSNCLKQNPHRHANTHAQTQIQNTHTDVHVHTQKKYKTNRKRHTTQHKHTDLK